LNECVANKLKGMDKTLLQHVAIKFIDNCACTC